MATKKRAAAVESDSTPPVEAGPAVVVSERYDNKGFTTACTLTMSDGTERTGKAKQTEENDPLDLAGLQAAAKADALGATE